jgi:thioredoxin-related protein
MRTLTKALLCLSITILARPARAEGPFLAISFAEAAKKAEAEKKLLFLDFYTTWCGPCKLMDQKTWKDAKVIDFLKNKVIALAIDADKETALAEKFRVTGYPTLLFTKPDGDIVEMAVGYLDPTEFLSMSELVVAGKDTMSRLAEALKRSPDDPIALVQLAETLAARGRHKEAVQRLTKVLESSPNAAISISVMPVAVYRMYNLSDQEPDAEATVKRLYEAVAKTIDDGKATDAQLALFSAVNLVNNEPGKTLGRYDELVSKGADAKFIERTTRVWSRNLIEESRFEDVTRRLNVPAVVKETLAPLPSRPADKPETPAPSDDLEEIARRQLIMQALDYYRALVALDRKDEAAESAREMLRVDGSATMYEALAWTGFSAGKAGDATVEYARKANELGGGKDVSKIDTLARVLHAVGKTDEAVKLVKDAQKWAEPGMEREALDRCLSDITA